MKFSIKKAAPYSGGDSLNCLNLGGPDDKKHTTPIKLNEDQIALVIRALSPKANQERRYIEYLARNPLAKTKDCCRNIACVNLGHLRIVTAPLLARFGLEAKCVQPPKPIKNGFGENTGQVHWGLYRVNAEVAT